MNRDVHRNAGLCSAMLFGALLPLLGAGAGTVYRQPTPVAIAKTERAADPTGTIESIRPDFVATKDNPFFQNLGANGRTCFSCHQPDQGWTVSAQNIRSRFRVSAGLDPIFRPVDGAVCPTAPTATLADKQKAYSLLLGRGVIRIGLPIPAGGEFSVTHINDPYKCTALRSPTAGTVSVYRRPLPATNLRLLSTVMWDGREGFLLSPVTEPGFQPSIASDLITQALDATTDHAEATNQPTTAQLKQIVDFEMGNTTAQIFDNAAQALNADGAAGGPQFLSKQPFYIGINDSVGLNPKPVDFTAAIFTRFDAWSGLTGDATAAARAAVARGEIVFNTKPLKMTNVNGVNDVRQKKVVDGFCGTCHDTPNGGGHSVDAPLNIGIAGAGRDAPPALDIAGLPVFTVTCKVDTYFHPANTPFQVTDFGRAMVTGNCIDVGKIKTPTLRGLAARAPYFHNGSAATLRDVVDFYDKRFAIGFTAQEKSDLVAFLRSL